MEYIFEVEKLIIHVSQYTNHIVFSYATTNSFFEKPERRFHGWVSDLSEADIIGIANGLNWKSKIKWNMEKPNLISI